MGGGLNGWRDAKWIDPRFWPCYGYRSDCYVVAENGRCDADHANDEFLAVNRRSVMPHASEFTFENGRIGD